MGAADFFTENGYYIKRELFGATEVQFFREHYMRLWAESRPTNDPTTLAKSNMDQADPLEQYPRLLQMHRWDDTSLNYLLNARVGDVLTEILGKEPYAVQTMFYYKPAGARGQALHQDQFYLKVQPGTCCAAWLALDDCDEENGCMQVVPGSQTWELLCTVPADTTQSFTDTTVPLPEGTTPIPMHMKAGDVLFFHGATVHGSFANTSKNRFRRSLIGHYIVGDAQKVGDYYHPVLRLDGSVVDLGISEGATTCGIWVDQEGKQVLEMVEKRVAAPEHE